MAQILSAAAKKPYSTQEFLSAELETLMMSLPKSWDTKTKYRYATRTLKALLRTKVNPKSAVQKILYKSAGDVMETWNRPTTYPNQSDAPGVNDNAKGMPSPQSEYPNRQSCVQANVNAGFSLAAANANCNRYFPPGPSQMGGVERRIGKGGAGGQSSKISTYYPTKSGFKQNPERLEVLKRATGTRSASVEGIPYWAYTVMDDNEINDLKNRISTGDVSHIRSAAKQQEIDEVLHGMSIQGVLESSAQRRRDRVERNNLKSASQEEQKPAWLRAMWAFKGIDN